MAILVVEPDGQLRDVIRFILEREGHAVLEAAELGEGLQLWHEHRPSLVIVAVDPPGVNAWEFVERVRAEDATPVVLLTTADCPADQTRSQLLRVAAHLSKPFSPRELLEAVQAVLGRR